MKCWANFSLDEDWSMVIKAHGKEEMVVSLDTDEVRKLIGGTSATLFYIAGWLLR